MEKRRRIKLFFIRLSKEDLDNENIIYFFIICIRYKSLFSILFNKRIERQYLGYFKSGND